MSDIKFEGVSNAELERRWALLRNLVKERQLDALVTTSNQGDNAGFVPWFTGDQSIGYREVAVFYPDDPMTLVTHGAVGQHRVLKGESADNPGVGEIYGTPEFPSVRYNLGYEADIVVDVLKKRGVKKVGLVGVDNMHLAFVETLRGGLGSVTFSDETEAVDGFMVVKSDEELDLTRRSAALQDDLFKLAVKIAKPGMRDVEITSQLRQEAMLHGVASGIFLAGSGPQGTFASFRPIPMQNRTIEPGDYLSLLIENSGIAGYYAEIARTIVFGKAQPVILEACQAATEMQHSIIKMYTPGTACADIYAQHNKERADRNFPPEKRIFSHGQGYNLVERPLIRDDEPMKLEAGMNFACHPGAGDGKTVFATMCDNFIVKASGAPERIHKTEQKVFEV